MTAPCVCGRFDQDLDVVPHLPVQAEFVGQRNRGAVHPGAGEALLAKIFEQVTILALLLPDERGQDREMGPL